MVSWNFLDYRSIMIHESIKTQISMLETFCYNNICNFNISHSERKNTCFSCQLFQALSPTAKESKLEKKKKRLINLTRYRRKATLRSNQRRRPNTINRRKNSSRIGPKRRRPSRRIQTPAKNSAHNKDRMFSFSRRRSELFTETDMSIECFFNGDKPLWSNNFVFDSFNAESTEPSTLISLTNFGDVCWCAFFCETTWIAFHTLNFNVINGFYNSSSWSLSLWLWLWSWNCHYLKEEEEKEEKKMNLSLFL